MFLTEHLQLFWWVITRVGSSRQARAVACGVWVSCHDPLLTLESGRALLTPRWMQAPESSGSPWPSITRPPVSRPRMQEAVTRLQSMPPPSCTDQWRVET